MKNKIFIAAVFMIALAAGAYHFAKKENQTASSGQNQSGDEKNIKVVYISSLEDVRFILDYAEDKGFFAKNKLNIEKITVEKGGNDVLAAGGGVLIGSNAGYFLSYLNGADFRLLANVFYSFTSFELSRYPLDQLSRVKTVAAAMSAAFGGEETKLYLKKHGADLTKIDFVKIPSLVAKERALAKGEIDFGDFTSEDFLNQIDARLKYQIVEPADVFSGTHFFKGIMTTQRTLEENPDGLRRFVKAVYEALNSASGDKEGTVTYLKDRYKMDGDRAEKFYARFAAAVAAAGFVPDGEFLQGLTDELRAAGTEIKTGDNSPEKYIYSQFAQDAVNQGGK